MGLTISRPTCLKIVATYLQYITQLVTVFHDFATAIDNHQQIDAVFLDLSKAFDRVPHNLLVARLSEIGLPDITVRWIKAYLKNCTQFVECDDVWSDSLRVLSGVPQGQCWDHCCS